MAETTQVPTFCPLCVSRCGATATVTDGEFVALAPDPRHPTGQALCVKGKAAPEIVRHHERLLYPLQRTRPKGDPDPGWRRVSWDEALDTVADRLRALSRDHGPESVVFGSSSPSTSAMSDAVDWVQRLQRAFGSPNLCTYMELCGWGRHLASLFTFGAPVPGTYLPDLDAAGCILFWGYNPSASRLVHATSTVAALRRGARLVMVDPRRVGLAAKADHWLRVRPGTDAALALAMTSAMIEHGWYDDDFVRRWTNAPLLVREDTGLLLRAGDVGLGDAVSYVAWDDDGAVPALYDPARGHFEVDEARLALFGRREVAAAGGPIACRPVFDLVAQRCRELAPAVAEGITGVPAADIESAARTLWENRPVAFYGWSGLEQHSNTTQAVRAINQLYALTGDLDVPGGNVAFTGVPTNPITGPDLLPPDQAAKALGLADRPLGPARFGLVTGEDLYTAALEGRPYPVRALVNFGADLVMANGDSARGREALAALDFFVHADLFLNPTAELADIVLPVTSAFESEGLRIGFEVSQAAQSLVQLRHPVATPRGEARSDLQIVFALATRLGLGQHFWDGYLDAAFRHQLAPSGITLEQLRARPEGVSVPLTTRHRTYTEHDDDGVPRGFATPSRRVELFSEMLADRGYPPLPEFEEPRTSPRSRPDLAPRFPLVLTSAKSLWFCETQHRAVATLRAKVPAPQVEIHPETAAARGIAAGDWVRIETPLGSIRSRAKFNASLDRGVVCGQHGWWQACEELGLPGYPPTGPGSANLNAVLAQGPSDPVSGSAPLRSSICDVLPL